MEQQGDAVLPQQGEIFRTSDHTAAGGDDQTALFGHIPEYGGFHLPECLFSVLRENILNGFSGIFGNQIVAVNEFPAQCRSQSGAGGAFAAAGHANQGNVHAVLGHLFPNGLNDAVVQLHPLKNLGTPLGLGHQHPQTVYGHGAFFFCLPEKFRFVRVVDQIKGGLQLGEGLQRGDGSAVVGVHAHGSGIDEDLRVIVCVQRGEVDLAFPGDGDNLSGMQIPEHCANGGGNAAVTEQQAGFAGYIHTAVANGVQKAVVIRIVAIQTSIRAADNGIDAADVPGLGRKLGAVGNDGFFIRNGDVDGVKRTGTEKLLQLFRAALEQIVIVAANHFMNLGGETVTQMFSQKSVTAHGIVLLTRFQSSFRSTGSPRTWSPAR